MEEREKNKNVDSVIDELKNVISNLYDAPRKKEIEPIAEDPVLSEPPVSAIEEPASLPPPTPPSQPLFSEPRVSSEKPPSDSDFWNGNVLGWPSDMGGEPTIPPLEESAKKFLTDPTPAPAATPIPTPENPEKVEIKPPPPSFSDRAFFMGDIPELPNETPSFRPPPPPAPIADEPWSMEALPPVPPAPSAPEPLPIPIPGTSTVVSRSGQEQVEAEPLDADKATEAKPAGLVQIACIYPEGEENLGQQFVTRLRGLGEKSKSALNIEAVFVSGWNSQAPLDIKAWMKSATLSGADVMFVLAPKKDLGLFKGFASDPVKDGIRTRLVTLEHIGLRTLYPDILIEVERGR